MAAARLLACAVQVAAARSVLAGPPTCPEGAGGVPRYPRSQATVFMQMTTAVSAQSKQGNASVPALAEGSFLVETAAMLRALPGQVYNGISMKLKYTNVWGEIETFPARRPRTFNVALATLKTFLADLVVQVGEAKQGEVSRRGWLDWRRSLTFAFFGFLYVGLIQWLLYVTALSRLCPHAITFGNEPLGAKFLDLAGQVDLVKQICYDNLVINPLIYFPVFYVIKGALSQKQSAGDKPGTEEIGSLPSRILEPLRKYAKNFWEDNAVSCAVWVPMDLFVFSAPMYLRMPLDHAVSFLWTMLLSHRRGGNVDGVH